MADAMRQILDFFDLLAAAGGKDGNSISWQLVAISMNSPLKATAQAISRVPGVLAEPIARREKAAVRHSLESAIRTSRRFSPITPAFKDRAKSLFDRNTTSIGRTIVHFDDADEQDLLIDQNVARQAVEKIGVYEFEQKAIADDHARTEFGSIECVVASLTTHYSHPALRVKERLTGADVVCILSDDLARLFGPQHNWYEVWSSKRLLLSGDITYRRDGRPAQIKLLDLEIVNSAPLKFADIAMPELMQGVSPQQYIDSFWEGDLG